MRDRVSNEEWQTRVDLAACYRLVHHYGMDDLVYNHISARVPGEEGHFLINAYGMTYDEITASSLVKIDFDGKVVQDSGTGYGINHAGFVIHSAVHRARPDVGCVIHTHSPAGMAVSALECGLLPLTQNAMFFDGVGMPRLRGPGDRPRRAEAPGARPRQLQGDDPAQPRPARGRARRSPRRSSTSTGWSAPARRRSRRWPATPSCTCRRRTWSRTTNDRYRPEPAPALIGELEWPALLRLADRQLSRLPRLTA